MTTHGDLAYRLILRAARSTLPTLAARLEEEWLADLATRADTLARLRLAVGCWWATGVITRDCAMPQVAVSGIGGGVRALLDGAHQGFPQLSRRTLAFLAIAGVHLLLIYGITLGLGQHGARPLTSQSQVSFIQETAHRDPPPPPLHPLVLKRPTFHDLPPVVPEIRVAPDADPGHELQVPQNGETRRPPAAPPAVVTPGGPGAGFPNTDDFYPVAARRLGQTGTTIVRVCVDPRGRLAGEPAVARSSGNPRLDEGALNLARAGSGHYRPSTQDGAAVDSCYAFRIRFRLE